MQSKGAHNGGAVPPTPDDDGRRASAGVISALRRLDLPEPDRAATGRIWQRVARQARRPGASPQAPTVPSLPLARPLLRAAVTALLIALFATGYWNVSAAALPGSALYVLKQANESLGWALAQTDDARTSVALALTAERRSEANRLVAERADGAVVVQTVSRGLAYLALPEFAKAAPQVAGEVHAWQAAASAWPAEYRAPAEFTLSQWVESHASILPSVPPLLPTVLPALPATPRATVIGSPPTLPAAVPSPRASVAAPQPVVTLPAPSPTLPVNVLPTLVAPLPTLPTAPTVTLPTLVPVLPTLVPTLVHALPTSLPTLVPPLPTSLPTQPTHGPTVPTQLPTLSHP